MPFLPPGFEQKSISTSLGQLVYATQAPEYLGMANREELPPLIFLHSVGGGSSSYEWSQVYPAFATRFKIIAPDLIGWGSSAHPRRQYSVTDYWLTVRELVDQLSRNPVPVIASSLTAAMTLRLAVQEPQRFQGLCLVCPAGFGELGRDYRQGPAAQLVSLPGVDQLLYGLGAGNELAVRTFLEQALFAQASRVTPEIVAAYLESALQPDAEYAALASLRGDLAFDLSTYIGQLSTPTVIVWGEADRFTGIQQGRQLATLNPGSVRKFCPIPGAGVLPQLELPALVIAAIERDFLPLLTG
jgi:pimeloyl-ACP methyl ester carboxylesterase